MADTFEQRLAQMRRECEETQADKRIRHDIGSPNNYERTQHHAGDKKLEKFFSEMGGSDNCYAEGGEVQKFPTGGPVSPITGTHVIGQTKSGPASGGYGVFSPSTGVNTITVNPSQDNSMSSVLSNGLMAGQMMNNRSNMSNASVRGNASNFGSQSGGYDPRMNNDFGYDSRVKNNRVTGNLANGFEGGSHLALKKGGSVKKNREHHFAGQGVGGIQSPQVGGGMAPMQQVGHNAVQQNSPFYSGNSGYTGQIQVGNTTKEKFSTPIENTQTQVAPDETVGQKILGGLGTLLGFAPMLLNEGGEVASVPKKRGRKKFGGGGYLSNEQGSLSGNPGNYKWESNGVGASDLARAGSQLGRIANQAGFGADSFGQNDSPEQSLPFEQSASPQQSDSFFTNYRKKVNA